MAKTRSALSAPTSGPVADHAIDWIYFVLGGLAAVWLAWVLLRQSFSFGWWQIAFVVVFWGALAYLVLPRLHRILTAIYVPDYFIGRARTSDGLLGDPVNLALHGSEAEVHQAMDAAGWTRADDLTFRTGMGIVKSTLTRKSYLRAPVSPLLLFGRKQDFAYQQEVDGSPGKRHHVRFWKCPDGWKLPGGHPADWLAAGTYDKSVGLSLYTLQITHKIADDTDDERDFIVKTVLDAEPAATVSVIRDFSTGYHSRNGGGDTIVTDGDLPVLDLRTLHPVDAAEVAVPTDSRDRRPSATVLGAILVAIGAVIGIVSGVQQIRRRVRRGRAGVHGPQRLRGARADPDDRRRCHRRGRTRAAAARVLGLPGQQPGAGARDAVRVAQRHHAHHRRGARRHRVGHVEPARASRSTCSRCSRCRASAR